MSNSPGKVAIVTGAGAGIGLATAKMLSAADWSLVLVGRTRSKLDAAGISLQGEWIAIEGDVADPVFVARVVESSTQRFGGIDALINAAGVAALATIPAHTPDMILSCFGANAIGPANFISAVWPLLIKRGGGRIVNVSSMASIDPFNGFFAYAASKSAMNMLTKVGDKEGKRQGIRCFCIAPGAVETDMLRSMFSTTQVPASAALPPEDVAKAIVECVLGERDAQAGEPIVVRK